MTKKDIFGKHTVEYGHVTSNELSPVENVEEYCISLLIIFKLNYGAGHIEFISKDEGLYLVEVTTGVDMTENIVLQSIGENSIVQLTDSRVAFVQFCIPEQLVI